MKYKTEQEDFWAGEFGVEYSKRNSREVTVAPNIRLFSRIFERTQGITSLIEFGSNIGSNLTAIRSLLPRVDLAAIEINEFAREELAKIEACQVYAESILSYSSEKKYDMTLVKGVLIHINPDELQSVYRKLYDSSRRYICIAEYYNPRPVEVVYRGHERRLFKRDFAGEIMDRFDDLALIDYGFIYHRDPVFPQDDLTWFLLEKQDRKSKA